MKFKRLTKKQEKIMNDIFRRIDLIRQWYGGKIPRPQALWTSFVEKINSKEAEKEMSSFFIYRRLKRLAKFKTLEVKALELAILTFSKYRRLVTVRKGYKRGDYEVEPGQHSEQCKMLMPPDKQFGDSIYWNKIQKATGPDRQGYPSDARLIPKRDGRMIVAVHSARDARTFLGFGMTVFYRGYYFRLIDFHATMRIVQSMNKDSGYISISEFSKRNTPGVLKNFSIDVYCQR